MKTIGKVQCSRDNAKFEGYVGKDSAGEYVSCPTCGRRYRYWKPDDELPVNYPATEPGWYSDRKLTILEHQEPERWDGLS